jgi:hypothetical protein
MARARRGEVGTPSAVITPKLEFEFNLDQARIAEIQRCLAKGKLTITMSRIDIVEGGRLADGYNYD